jgi:glycerophosphoryl diester phosphodiesterase
LIFVLLGVLLAAGDPVMVIAHRGEHLHHPENTMEAFQGAVDAGADFFELDVRTTSDGKLILMHDATVDRMTNGKGNVAQMTFEEIRKLDVHGSRVPTFNEALEFARGKIGVYVDSKNITPVELVSALEAANMSAHVVVYGGAGFLKEVRALRPALKVMPEASSLENLKSMLPLKAIAFDARDFLDPLIAAARETGADIFVDRLGPADNEVSWQDAIDRGATGIQTDYPARLAAYLKSKGLHR